MDIFANILSATLAHAHGEVNFFRIDAGDLPADGWEDFTDISSSGGLIVGHSEQGHHHVLDRDGVTIRQRQSNGFQILKAIVTKPTALRQEAGNPHETQIIQPGTYVITTALEKPFFQDQARRVAD